MGYVWKIFMGDGVVILNKMGCWIGNLIIFC